METFHPQYAEIGMFEYHNVPDHDPWSCAYSFWGWRPARTLVTVLLAQACLLHRHRLLNQIVLATHITTASCNSTYLAQHSVTDACLLACVTTYHLPCSRPQSIPTSTYWCLHFASYYLHLHLLHTLCSRACLPSQIPTCLKQAAFGPCLVDPAHCLVFEPPHLNILPPSMLNCSLAIKTYRCLACHINNSLALTGTWCLVLTGTHWNSLVPGAWTTPPHSSRRGIIGTGKENLSATWETLLVGEIIIHTKQLLQLLTALNLVSAKLCLGFEWCLIF